MDLMQSRRACMAERLIGGLPVLLDNAMYVNANGALRGNVINNTDYFIAGPFDTGGTGSKKYTVVTQPKGGDYNASMRFFNSLAGSSVDFWGISTSGDVRIFTSSGQYICFTVKKSEAAETFVFDHTNFRYVCAGSGPLRLAVVYGEGLTRTYESYSYWDQRARTEAIFIPAGVTATFTLSGSTHDAALGVWKASDKSNLIYSGWNAYASYTPTEDVFAQLVFRRKNETNIPSGEFSGIVTVTVGDKTFKS